MYSARSVSLYTCMEVSESQCFQSHKHFKFVTFAIAVFDGSFPSTLKISSKMMGYFQLIALLLSICICNCISKRLMSPYKVTVVGMVLPNFNCSYNAIYWS